ncbi:FtsB family cell division protein [Corynebacterium auriscanis]|uniref:FtsB family cell division protein n=1 Tax=Corynebacterium auriscanis TaxID=99807 RepID=UPI003CF1CBDE
MSNFASSKRNTGRTAETEAGADRPRLPQARSVQRQQERRRRVHNAPGRMARSFVTLPQKVNPLATVISISLVIFLALSIATPLRNYFEQRAEIARLENTIQAQEQRKRELTDELNRYHNEDYIKEQARTRLGLIEPGESAFRIISPHIGSSAPGDNPTDDAENNQGDREWYQKLWDSISVPEPTPEQIHQEQEQTRLPTIPTPPKS